MNYQEMTQKGIEAGLSAQQNWLDQTMSWYFQQLETRQSQYEQARERALRLQESFTAQFSTQQLKFREAASEMMSSYWPQGVPQMSAVEQRVEEGWAQIYTNLRRFQEALMAQMDQNVTRSLKMERQAAEMLRQGMMNQLGRTQGQLQPAKKTPASVAKNAAQPATPAEAPKPVKAAEKVTTPVARKSETAVARKSSTAAKAKAAKAPAKAKAPARAAEPAQAQTVAKAAPKAKAPEVPASEAKTASTPK
jgi:hypothetical protein